MNDDRVQQALDQAREECAKWARDDADISFSIATSHGVTSPIEQMFYIGMLPHLWDDSNKVIWQVPIGPYRVDFVVTISAGVRGLKPVSVVVECDGHDFHEKTRKQAERDKQRDRYLSQAGYRVMRFTGRELWRDPFKCAGEVIAFLTNEYYVRQLPPPADAPEEEGS